MWYNPDKNIFSVTGQLKRKSISNQFIHCYKSQKKKKKNEVKKVKRTMKFHVALFNIWIRPISTQYTCLSSVGFIHFYPPLFSFYFFQLLLILIQMTVDFCFYFSLLVCIPLCWFWSVIEHNITHKRHFVYRKDKKIIVLIS